MKILITGANGQLGTQLRHLFDSKNISYVATDSKELDITDSEAVNNYFDDNKPEIVYHCAAYTAVDPAEEEPGRTINRKVNEDGTRNIANASNNVGSTLIYISTDYVFDGNNENMYTEDSTPNPKNEYGRSKLLGEELVSSIMDKYYIVRTSWVFGEYGKNFVYTMLKLAEDHDQLTVVDDQFGRPTWTKTLSEFMVYLVDTKAEYGLYQLSNDNSCSWFEFATEILKDKKVKVLPVTSDEFPQKAYRPKHSIMDLSKAKSTGFVIPTWQEALADFLKIID